MNDKSKFGIGIDLGGTKILGTLVDISGNIFGKVKFGIDDTNDSNSVMKKIAKIVENFKSTQMVSSIGIGSAGFVDYKRGIVLSSPNIKFLNEFPLAEEIKKLTNIETFIDNDIKMGAFAELYVGEGRNVNDFVFITFGTGIGGAIVINKKIVRGFDNLAGEIGHLTLVENGYLCGCGKRGHFETLSSGPAIRRYFLEQVSFGRKTKVLEPVSGNLSLIDVPLISEFAKNGDELSLESLNYAMHYIALVVSYVIDLLNPEKIILGGGLLEGLEPVYQNLLDEINEYALDIPLKSVDIVKSSLGENAISIGAGIFGLMKKNITGDLW
ncbi:MAG: ROK family protein [Caldiserica bacterium]|nr:ROK family protein [Caldisericota bacterium]